jgi:hypothetical protein
MFYSAISELSFFDQFEADKNMIINELEFDNNKNNNLENSMFNIVKNIPSSRNNNIKVKDGKGNLKDRVSTEQNKNNCGC